MLDAPTLFEAGADRLCRRVVSVLADETVRLGRICRRDGLTEQEALTRMHAQQSDDFTSTAPITHSITPSLFRRTI